MDADAHGFFVCVIRGFPSFTVSIPPHERNPGVQGGTSRASPAGEADNSQCQR
ncbi:MAG: hypothetical protein LBD30_01005 [Verrucomicrobiales bacterium]|nr:hypothetical protein [Verrucomicrobiales bacterium]